jgi:hypothetical protein
MITCPIQDSPPSTVGLIAVWVVGIITITLLGFLPVVGAGIIPLVKRRTYHRIMAFFVALGVGSLTGNSVFNLIPQVGDMIV